jgi:hypothetical protein
MKKYLYILFLIILYSNAFSQPYGNEWLAGHYNQQYFRIFVVKDGIYRIDSATLAKVGIWNVDARFFQIFGRGTEDSIYIKYSNSDKRIHGNDYIEFYAMHNDGWYDSKLYHNPADQANPNYSMFNDTAIYYLTYNSSFSNRRLTIDTSNNFSSYTPAAYINKVSRVDYTSSYFYGYTDGNELTDPEYISSEGWFDAGFGIGGSISKSIPTLNKYGSGNATIEFLLIGESDYTGLHPNHHIRMNIAGNSIFIDTTFDKYYTCHYQRTVPISYIGSSNTSFTFTSVYNYNNGADNNTIAYINIKYPHTLNLEGDSSFVMGVPYYATGQAKSYLNISNFAAIPGDSIIFYDLTDHRRIRVVKNGNNFQVLVPNSSNEKKCFITSASQVIHVTSIEPVNYDLANYALFTNYSSPSVKNSNYLIVTHKSLLNEANNYAFYRSSPNGGSYIPLVADVNELYDQFSYGIRKDPLAIRNFAHYAYDKFDSVKDVFLIGKGYTAIDCRNNPYYYSSALIPGFGAPPSDVLFTAFGSDFKPMIPIGRLAARNPTHVDWYLNKIIEYDTAQYNAEHGLSSHEWMKNVLHFGGGTDIYQQNVLASYLNGFANIIKGPYFGGYVRTFLKSSTAPIQMNESDSLKNIINKGVSLMTFFGHAAGTGFDQSIDVPSAYDNVGRYPFLLANSCYAGDLFQDVPTSSEEFVLIQEKGMIAYLASISVGIDYLLNNYSSVFYHNFCVSNYGQSVGKCIQKTIDSLAIDSNNKFVCLDMTLHGDPAIKINSFSKPDYMINQQNVYFTPTEVTTQDTVFTVNVISTNIGKALDTNFIVDVNRKYPDGSFADSSKLMRATYYKDTIKFKFPVNIIKGVGMNYFTITLDYLNHIQELSETNNTVTVSLLIKSNDITPVYPYKYAVVPSLNVTLKASTGDPFAPARNYIFEVDTTDAFTNPLLTHTVNHTGGVVTWTPTLPITTDSIVYFWRVSVVPASGTNYNWKESSFQYINGKRGWGQAHFFQFKNDIYQYVNYVKPSRKFTFANNIISLFSQTGYWYQGAYTLDDEKVLENGTRIAYWNCAWLDPGIKFVVFDYASGNFWNNPASPSGAPYFTHFGDYHCSNHDVGGFDFYITPTTNDSNMRKIVHFLNLIPQNDYVLVLTHKSNYCLEWSDSLVQAFLSIGSTIGTGPYPGYRIDDNSPYILFGQKGASPGSRPFTLGNPYGGGSQNLINRSDTIMSHWNIGYIKSEIIGPASKWNSLHWRTKSIDPVITADKVKLNVLGIKSNGVIDTLLKNISYVHDSIDIINLYQKIPAARYPYLQLVLVTKDDSFKTPSQLIRWQVLFDGVPETALDPSIHFSFHKDTLQEGDSIRFSVATHNISDYNMDSLLIHYWIIDQNRNVHQIFSHKYRKHPAGDTLISSVNYCTTGLSGLNSLWIEVNPNNNQPEQYHFNNIGDIYFKVNADKINPLLDVTFDGVHILDGDIVSAKPMIEMRLKDENKFLLMNNISDTSLFNVFIQDPGASSAQRIYFRSSSGQENMRFYPASSSSDNKCRIEYNADFPIDGTYKLIVQSKDISKNKPGSSDYKIDFDVINKSTITEVMNWPNPFSTATRFVFTLTGSEIPTYFKIEIMTITGKIVREIEVGDLGSIHIGRNITQYAWDGKDDFGDQLANGVYLYRVITNINGKSIDKNPTAADKYFKQEFGKMYLMR